MAGQNNSLSQVGATPGIIKPKPVAVAPGMAGLTFGNQPTTPTAQPVAQGNVSGQSLAINSTALSPGQFGGQAQPSPYGEVAKPTIQKDVSGNTYQAPKSNPSVLAQQQALNKLGAGLVEDGIAGPKTREAISKYGTSTPTEQPKTVEQPKAPEVAKAPEVVTPPAPSIDTSSDRARGVLEAGKFTPTEKGLVEGGAVSAANKNLTDLRQNMAEKIGDIESTAIPLEFQQGRSQVLQRQFASQEAAAQQGLANALANQGQLLGAAQTQAGRAAGAAGNIFSAGLFNPSEYGKPAFNPLTGEFTGNGQFGGVDASSNIQSIKDYTTRINDIDSQSDAISNNFSRAIAYATNAGLTGNTPLLEGFKNKFGTNFLTNPAVIGFNQVVGALNTQLQAFGEQPIDVETATAQTLKQAQETVRKNILTQKSNLQSKKDALMGSGTSGSSTGDLFSW